MSIPLLTLNITSVLGQTAGINNFIIADVFGTGSNLWMDKYGRLRQIEGYLAQNGSAVTTHVGNAARVRGLFQARRIAVTGNKTWGLLGVFQSDTAGQWDLKYSANSGSTWTHLNDYSGPPIGTNGEDAVIGTQPDFVQWGDVVYFTVPDASGGYATPNKWLLTSPGSAATAVGRTQAPTPTAAAGAAGNLTGTYKWKLVTRMTDGTRGAGSVASNILPLTAKKGSLTWSASGDTNVAGYEVYRTTATGASYYFVDYVDGRTTVAYTDNIPDLTILQARVIAEVGDPPGAVALVEAHKQRMWWGRTTSYPTKVWFSDPGLPEDVNNDNNLDFIEAQTAGDFIVGMVGGFKGNLIVFTDKTIWMVTGTGQSFDGIVTDWNKVRMPVATGATSNHCIVTVPAGANFTDEHGAVGKTTDATLVYLTPFGDIRLFDGSRDRIISNTPQSMGFTKGYQSYAVLDTSHTEIIFAIPTGYRTFRYWVWNYYWGVWYERSWGKDFLCMMVGEDFSAAPLFLAGEADASVGGYIYRHWNGLLYFGTAGSISSSWTTKSLFPRDDSGTPQWTTQHRFRWADFMFSEDTSSNANKVITVKWWKGNDDPASATAVGSKTATFNLSTTTTTQARANVRVLLKTSTGRFVHDEGIILQMSLTNAGTRPWVLEGITVYFQSLPGNQRGMQ